MSDDTNDQIMGDSTEEENKVDIEKTTINLNCVKNEVIEENLQLTQYRVALENIIGVDLPERKFEEDCNNLIGFLDNDAIMENVGIKLESIKKEDDENFHYCNKCNGYYKGYCLICSTLSHILNNTSSFASPKSEINTMPMNIVEIKYTSVGKGIFLLKTLPKNIIFGPFEGILATRNAKVHGWKINNKRLENTENGNWMKNIACAINASIKNLDVFQMKGNLYFETNREIMESEELLVYYNDEEIQKLADSQECYFIPRKQQEKLPKIFACTLCCLGFRLAKCLKEHKGKCPHGKHNTDFQGFELIECHCCKIWLEKKEYEEYHMGYCKEKYRRMSFGHSQSVDRNEVCVEEMEDPLSTKAVQAGFKSPQCLYKMNYQDAYQAYLNQHLSSKSFECDICKMKFTVKENLKMHIKNKHTENGTAKDYQCSECSFQTNDKQAYQAHLLVNHSIELFECDICNKKYTLKSSLNTHIKRKHTENGVAEDYQFAKNFQCSECSFQTNYKRSYQAHLLRHRGIKLFDCDVCNKKFTLKGHLTSHIKRNHTKDYQCSECSYKTNDKWAHQKHLNGHRGTEQFKCDICNMKFYHKVILEIHVKNKH